MGQKSNVLQNAAILLSSAAFLVGCANDPNFSLMSDTNSFSQIPKEISGKIDILFVVDNSGSMAGSQQNLADNMEAFIQAFQSKGMDFRMAVISTDAWQAGFGQPASMAQFRDGTDATSHTGVYVIEPNTPNLTQTFMTNLLQGTKGTGDERVFQSLREALTNQVNASYNFPRPEAFLSIIVLSDEDDFSHDGSDFRDNQYDYAGLHKPQMYVDFLDQFTASVGRPRQYNVNTIAILDQACLDKLPGLKIGKRYIELSTLTNGIMGSLCDNFAATLANISNKIIQLSTKFYLNRRPHPETIRVVVDGKQIPNNPATGWQYNPDDNSISFPGSFTPPAHASIAVSFDPSTLL